MNIYEKLAKIQSELKVPKNQKNTFGNYNYRSCEDILEAVKPLLNEQDLVLVIDDEVVNVGDRNYVKSTVKLIDTEDKEGMFTTAYAREDEVKKGMDGSQLTGSTSSYARKYALNGLFAIDDTKDSDVTNIHGKGQEKADKPNQRQQSQGGEVKFYCSDCGVEVNQAVHSYSTNKFKKCLCMNCQKKVK